MSNEQLFQQVETLLQRKLTPEERRFLVLATEAQNRKPQPVHRPARVTARIA